jgi:hypothetical protein
VDPLESFFAPFLGPLQGVIWVFQQIEEWALSEMYDPEKLKAELIQLQVSYERGEMSEADYLEAATHVWKRLREASQRESDLEDSDSSEG